MEDLHPLRTQLYSQREPWRNIMLLLGLILLGMSIGNLLGVIAVTVLSQFYTPLNMEQLAELLQTPNRFSGAWVYIMIIQVFAHLFTFLIPSLVYWQWSEKHRIAQFFRKSAPSWPVLTLAFLVVLGVETDDAAKIADVLIVAVKPQDIEPLLRTLAGAITPGTLVVSLCAGLPTSLYERHLPAGTPRSAADGTVR